MKLYRISFLFLLLFLFIPSLSFAQNAANKSWNPFWTQFKSAVKTKDKAVIRRAMSSESDFITTGGIASRNDFMKMFNDKSYWKDLQESVDSGVKSYVSENGRPARKTKNNYLIFQYIGGKWRFVGLMGD